MTAYELLEDLRSHGLRVILDGNDLLLRGRRREVIEQHQSVVHSHKAELLAYLSSKPFVEPTTGAVKQPQWLQPSTSGDALPKDFGHWGNLGTPQLRAELETPWLWHYRTLIKRATQRVLPSGLATLELPNHEKLVVDDPAQAVLEAAREIKAIAKATRYKPVPSALKKPLRDANAILEAVEQWADGIRECCPAELYDVQDARHHALSLPEDDVRKNLLAYADEWEQKTLESAPLDRPGEHE